MDFEDIPWWGWALGIGAAGAAATGIAYIVQKVQPTPTLPTITPTPSPSPPKPTVIQPVVLAKGDITIAVAPGTVVELQLPDTKHGYWRVPISVSGHASVGSAPSSGSNPASLTYNGGGAKVVASWWDCCADVPLMPPAGPYVTATITLWDA